MLCFFLDLHAFEKNPASDKCVGCGVTLKECLAAKQSSLEDMTSRDLLTGERWPQPSETTRLLA